MSSQEAVEQAEAYLSAHPDAPLPVSRLSRLVGLSERGLREAFYRVRGMGPKRWIVAARLRGVRSVLRNQSVAPTTVTGVAADHGFYELGRFAALYREAFGEKPSETLRSRGRESTPTDRSPRNHNAFSSLSDRPFVESPSRAGGKDTAEPAGH
jgi:transcriptional regulator GlxA family with amidase domain